MTTTSAKSRIGVMTCALNEVACVAFTVGAVVDHVDVHVLIDTGSTDGTPDLVRELFADQCRSGRLIVEEIGALPDHDMSIARNRALEILRAHKVDHFIKLDADTVFYDEGIRRTLEAIRALPAEITVADCGTHELYQYAIDDNAEWVAALRERRDVFFELATRPTAPLVHALDGAYATGKWGDEFARLKPEGIQYDRAGKHRTLPGVVAAHYGWARPLQRKREKLAAWNSPPSLEPRFDSLHLGGLPLHRFTQHPEVVARRSDEVAQWLRARQSLWARIKRSFRQMGQKSVGSESGAPLSPRAIMRIVMAAFFAAGFVLHLRATDALVAITPDWVPDPHFVVLVTGWIELALAAMLLVPRLRRITGIALALYVLAVWPANFKHALDHIVVPPIPDSWWYHAPRLALQPFIAWWALFATRVIDWPFGKTAR